MKNTTTPNWNEIVRLLLEHHTQMELTALTGVHQGTISDLNRGELKPRLSYESGAALVKAHEELCQKQQQTEEA